MADSPDYFTLAEIAAINDVDLSGIQVSSLFDDTPVLQRLAAVKASNGHLHNYLDYTAAPTVGARAANDGRQHDRSEDTVRTVTCTILDASFSVDMALAKIWLGGEQAFIEREAMRHLKAGMFWVEKQIFRGTTDGDASGFVGFAEILDAVADANVVSAGASSVCSSVYLIRSNPDEVSVVAGNNAIIDVGEATVQRLIGSSTGAFPGWFVPITGWYGLQWGSQTTSSVRIANVGTAEGTTVTDDLIYSGLELFPASRQPNMICMSRRSLEQLRDSRTATNATGAPAPRPTEVEGIPIVVTDGISDDETAVS